MRNVSVVGIGQIPVKKEYTPSLRKLGSQVANLAMEDAGVDRVDALFVGNMLSDELQSQKHLGALIASDVGMQGIEALQIRAATASGAAALRLAYLAVASGQAGLALAVGVEKMSGGVATPALAKALDAEDEVPDGATLISRNAELMRLYFDKFDVPDDGLVNFSVNAHKNAHNNPNALFKDKTFSARHVRNSRMIHAPMRLLDSSPICDGAAAILLAPSDEARAYTNMPVDVLASSVATDVFKIFDRDDPLWLEAASTSAKNAFRQANANREDVSFYEVHDAFSITACLLLEAVGFANQGQGWRLAAERKIGLRGAIPLSTMGGLKARGHPIGATALYQACEMTLQLTGRAGKNQIRNPQIALVQSVGGVGSTVITHIFGV